MYRHALEQSDQYRRYSEGSHKSKRKFKDSSKLRNRKDAVHEEDDAEFDADDCECEEEFEAIKEFKRDDKYVRVQPGKKGNMFSKPVMHSD